MPQVPENVKGQHFQIHVSDVEPAPVKAASGWNSMDIRWVVGNEKAGSEAGSEQICMFRAVFAPGARHARHFHDNAAEAFYVIRGRGAAGTGDEEHEVGPGTALHVPAGSVHWLRNIGDEDLELVGVYSPVGSLEDSGYVYVGEVTDEYKQVV
jgi:quercetin dioxygenase-like cupin family protein